MIRVLICDDQVVICEGLRAILSTAADIEVVGVANDGAQAVEIAAQLHPDVALMDLKMPVMTGIQATRLIRAQSPHTRVLVLTTYDFDEWVFDAIRSGASGYLLKDTPRETLIAAIRGTAEGKTYVDPVVAGKLFDQVSRGAGLPDSSVVSALSERELDVLRLIGRGFSNAEIAQHLYLSEGTVRNYVSAILTKLEVADRTQAAVLALRAGLADLKEGS
jgi:DNA-binding NarL/FixJ family response regulator